MSDLYSGAVADPALPDQPFTDWAWRVAGYVDGLAAAAGGIGSGGAYETAPASDFAAVSNSDTPLAASDNTTAAGHAYLIRPRPVYPRAGHSKLQPLAGLERPDSVALGRLSPFGGSFFMAGGRHLDSLPPMCPRFAASPPPPPPLPLLPPPTTVADDYPKPWWLASAPRPTAGPPLYLPSWFNDAAALCWPESAPAWRSLGPDQSLAAERPAAAGSGERCQQRFASGSAGTLPRPRAERPSPEEPPR